MKDFDRYDFTEPISHYMFDVKKISVKKMNMDFLILPVSKEMNQLLEIEEGTNMIKSSRTVYTDEDNKLYYHLNFYCAEKLAHLNTEKFI